MSETPPQHAPAERAVTVLMAMVPCGADTARQILAATARAADAGPRETAEAVLALAGGGTPQTPLRQALADAMDEARSATAPVTQPYTRLLPDPQAIGALLKRHRGLRSRALAAPHDLAVRNELDDATYTLCILMGQRNAHTALRSAELLLGTEWLGTNVPGGADRRPEHPSLPGSGTRQQGATGRDFP
ncbi:DUF5133 domain-containing protein [Streptomyces sp. NBC_01278]|uniref:DUF5133 domain-containing protein n=1 Tax=Streptomyces sp. NBC_01278 TaxID=2903809 RepID=UPI002E319D78|nr:DUF5133 domain-containing protein [Streptomyces sp. NBC_01278]